MKDKMARIGPCTIPQYHGSAWSKIPDINLEDVWRLVGPNVEMNLNRVRYGKRSALCTLKELSMVRRL